MHHPTSSQTNNYTYFTEQARRVGHMGSEIGRTQHERLLDHRQQQQHLHPQAHIHPHFFAPPHSLDRQEAIQREIEKERIREEIIISDIVRRRVLEAEVRRELMMERELALRRGENVFPFGSSPIADSPMGFPFLCTRSEGSSVEERIAFRLTDRERLNERYESGRFESLPFHRQTPDLTIPEAKPVLEGGKEKEQIKLGKPNENVSGSKRKAPSPSPTPPPPPPAGVDASEPPPDIISTKRARQEWNCDICQVSATCQNGLSEHLQGKKHKSKEAAVGDQRAGKNYSMGLQPKRHEKTADTISKTDDDPPPLRETLKSDDSKKNQSVALVQKRKKSGDTNKKKYRFWCEMCQVGTRSQKVMNDHKMGKKHMGRLERCHDSRKLVEGLRNEEEKGSEKEAGTEKLGEEREEEKPRFANSGEMSSGHENASTGDNSVSKFLVEDVTINPNGTVPLPG